MEKTTKQLGFIFNKLLEEEEAAPETAKDQGGQSETSDKIKEEGEARFHGKLEQQQAEIGRLEEMLKDSLKTVGNLTARVEFLESTLRKISSSLDDLARKKQERDKEKMQQRKLEKWNSFAEAIK